MSNQLRGTLAIFAVDLFERILTHQELEPQLTIYVQYIKDIGTSVPGTKEAHDILTCLSSKHPTIQFELELHDNDGC